MQTIYNSKVKETLYVEKLKNGLTVMIIPKKGIQKKYIIWGTRYGSNDNKFIVPGTNEPIEVPKGVAHFLEHKMFEQENGKNSLDVLTSIGVSANAYTTNDHTAYLYECTENFYEALDEFMDYVQHPYFTDQNVEKEKGIIGQEIKMYDDYPEWRVYLNALEAMYYKNPVKLDITGTVETISHIDKDILYKCYNTFYNPSNMCMVVSGDFDPESLIEEIKKRLLDTSQNGEIKRIFEEEPERIVKSKIEQEMNVSKPIFTIGIKCKAPLQNEKVRMNIAMEIILNTLVGESSNLYKEMYQAGNVFSAPSISYEFGDNYAHILISENANDPELFYNRLREEIENFKKNGINIEDFERNKKMIYGEYVKEYNDITGIARMFLADFMKGINSFDYLEEIGVIDLNFVNQVLKENFNLEKMVLSVVK
jgi:predicted Zn-dependent peptidase